MGIFKKYENLTSFCNIYGHFGAGSSRIYNVNKECEDIQTCSAESDMNSDLSKLAYEWFKHCSSRGVTIFGTMLMGKAKLIPHELKMNLVNSPSDDCTNLI